MTSSQSDEKKDSQTSESPPAGGGGYPPIMGYPTPMGYPSGNAPPAPGYPSPPPPPHYPLPPPGQPSGYPNYNNNTYPYTQAPPTTYYNPHMYNVQQEIPISPFVRGIIGGLILLIVFMCITSILMWLILRPAIPVVRVDSLSVSKFSGSTSFFTANWDANLTVENPNTKLKIYFDQIQAFMYYDEEDLLASSFAHPFLLETQQSGVIRTKFVANNSDHTQAGVGSWVVEKMVNEKSATGKLSFGLRMAIWSTFKSGSWWARHVTIRVYCEDLQVNFVGKTGNGNFANHTEKNKECLVFA